MCAIIVNIGEKHTIQMQNYCPQHAVKFAFKYHGTSEMCF